MPADGQVDISIDVGALLGRVPRTAVRGIQDVLGGLRREWREILLAVWPVDTGRSLQGWQNKVVGLVWVLTNPVPYAEFVHVQGDSQEVWQYLDVQAQRLVQQALPEMRAIVASAAGAEASRRERSVPSLASRLLRARATLNTRTTTARRARDLNDLRRGRLR